MCIRDRYNPAGEIFEVTDAGDMVWRYVNPVDEDGPVPENVEIENNTLGGVFRYPLDYAAFEGKDLTPQGPIELEGIEETTPANHIEFEISSPVFAYSTTISYQLGVTGHVSIKLYNALGQKVRTLVNEVRSAGFHQVTWDGTDNLGSELSPGVYFCSFQAGELSLRDRMVLIR